MRQIKYYLTCSMVHDIIWKAYSHSACLTTVCFFKGNRRFITVFTKAHHRNLHLVPRLKNAWSCTPFPNASAWRGAQLSTGTHLLLTRWLGTESEMSQLRRTSIWILWLGKLYIETFFEAFLVLLSSAMFLLY